MVSARGRKRTQQGRRSQKERRTQRGRRPKSNGRRSPSKQRKRRGQAKHQPMEKQRKRALTRSINAKMLNRIKRDGRFLSHQAKVLMISFVEDIYKQVSSEAERLRRESRDPLISPTHVHAALQRVVPKRRWRHVSTVVSRNRH